ncbi:hypothetical protein [Pedobacter sp. GR22-10]|uniref:hypothetical protein n=1 Tax=Pedobacter sp. GR22-10 TaxID=2994472 RepID=UPI0022483DC6|nr:hypothetical protein [Pedobacter sp. GR22-10]MCX2429927.1 hypothetical protein [Pedobacter sp. GR22-10]
MENLLEKELKKWQSRAHRYASEGIFSEKVLNSPLFIKEQIASLDRISLKFNRLSEDDLIQMKLLKQERRNLEQILYPNALVRIIARIINSFKFQKEEARVSKSKQMVAQDVRTSMAKTGFGNSIAEAETKMKEGKEFSLPVSFYVNERDRMDFQLQFKKDEDQNFIFRQYKATLFNEQTKEKKEHFFKVEPGYMFNSEEAFHLLSERAVYISHPVNGWQALDFTDKDADGNYRVKSFPDQYSHFNLEEALLKLPFKDEAKLDLEDCKKRLQKGERVEFEVIIQNVSQIFSLQVNPQKKEIEVYNAANEKISPYELNPRKHIQNTKESQDQNKSQSQVQKSNRKNGHAIKS